MDTHSHLCRRHLRGRVAGRISVEASSAALQLAGNMEQWILDAAGRAMAYFEAVIAWLHNFIHPRGRSILCGGPLLHPPSQSEPDLVQIDRAGIAVLQKLLFSDADSG